MTTFDFSNPPEAYCEAFYVWLRANRESLFALHADFLADTGKTRYDEGCSCDEFCTGLFRETAAGKAALEVCTRLN